MRKLVSMLFTFVMLTGLIAANQNVFAQDGDPLAADEWVEGELTVDDFEDTYTFEGTAGDVILIEMYAKPGTFGLDPEVALQDPAGGDLARNDDFVGLGAVIVRRLAFDGTYTVLATRSRGEEGSSEGEYILRLTVVEAYGPGSELTATLSQDSNVEVPDVFVLAPEDDVEWIISFSHDGDELYPEITLESWTGESFEDVTVFEVDGEALTAAALQTSLAGGEFYLLSVRRSFYSNFGEAEATVTLTIDEATE